MSKLKMQNSKLQLKIKNFYFNLFVFSFLFLFLPLTVTNAAEITFSTSETSVGPGQRMEIVVLLDTEGEKVNAYEGVVVFPDTLSIEEVREGGSFISFWVQKPYADGNRIPFSGITPGGFSGNQGEMFRVIAAAGGEGTGAIRVEDVQVLLHDGEGTHTNTRSSPLAFTVHANIPVTDLILAPDVVPPEPFTLVLSRDPAIFDNDYFLAFETKDVHSGIDRYEALETRDALDDFGGGMWKIVESPYRIADQSLTSYVYIRAVDKEGHTRIAVFKPSLFDVITELIPFKDSKTRIIFVIISGVLAFLLLYVLGRRGWQYVRRKRR